MGVITERFRVEGMQCPGCETVLEEAVGRLRGVRAVHADYARETVEVVFEQGKTRYGDIRQAIIRKGYSCAVPAQPRRRSRLRTFTTLLAGLAAIVLFLAVSRWAERIDLPELDQNLSYGLLFLVGLLTGFHCVGMCGGFILGYTTQATGQGRHSFAFAHLLYGFGKTLSYTVIGGLFGWLGSVVAFTPQLRGAAAILAGIVLVGMGLSMLKLFPALRIGVRMPGPLRRFLHAEFRKHRSPLVIGLLNGLMIACGPLQAMYVMAAGTGSFLEGAKRLFIYGAGTLPVLIGFGVVTSLLSHRATERVLRASAALVVVLGLFMVDRGLVLSGSGYNMQSLVAVASVQLRDWAAALREPGKEVEPGVQEIRMTVTKAGYRPDTFRLKQGVPVRWIIDVRDLTYCNRRITVPALELEFDLAEGEQVIEFIPRQAGVLPWSCWMGMLPGSFIVEPAGTPKVP